MPAQRSLQTAAPVGKYCQDRGIDDTGQPLSPSEGAKSAGRRSRNPMEDRQNHGRTESWGTKTESGLAVHNRRRRMNLLFMILSRHDSVFRGGARIPRSLRTTLAIAVQRKDAGEGFPLRALRVSAVKWAARKEPPPANDLRPPAAFGFPAPPGCAFSRLLPGSRCSPAATRFPSPPLEERAGERREVGLKSEARSPRAERRPSSEIRRPKPEAEGDSAFGLLSAFDLRPSDFRLRRDPAAAPPSRP